KKVTGGGCTPVGQALSSDDFAGLARGVRKVEQHAARAMRCLEDCCEQRSGSAAGIDDRFEPVEVVRGCNSGADGAVNANHRFVETGEVAGLPHGEVIGASEFVAVRNSYR